MDSLFFHPKIVHLPIALALLMPLMSTALVIAWWRKWLPPHAFVIAAALQAILVVSGFMAMNSGEDEEHAVEKFVDKSHIHEHEEAAEAFVYVSAGLLLLMLAGVFTARKRAGLPIAALATAGTFFVVGLAYETGHEGGDLVYKYGAANAYLKPENLKKTPGAVVSDPETAEAAAGPSNPPP